MGFFCISSLQRWLGKTFAGIFIITLMASLLTPQFSASAATTLTVTPLTWNVVGLDSNNVLVGPSNFPVGARVCNTGTTPATNIAATFVWSPGSPYINLRAGSKNPLTLATLAAGTPAAPACSDFYFEVSVTRNALAYDTTRSYRIDVTADTGIALSTPSPREIYVEHLISQNRNSTSDVKLNGGSIAAGGTMSLQVGNTYTIELDGSTATQGYNQLEDFINFPNTIFQVLSVQSHYSADSSGYVANSSDKLYADACLWDNNPASPTYRSCIGSDGKVGGTISNIYTVKVIGGAGTTQTLNTLIYDFSGSSYHYNSDFSTQARFASISSPLTLSKSFLPVSITGGGTSALSILITNTSASAVSGIAFTDTFPGGLTVVGTPTTPQCGGVVSSTTGSVTLTGGSLVASGDCTITVNVTASTNGTYLNQINQLLVNGADAGVTASSTLTVAATVPPGGICSSGPLAQWTFPSGSSATAPLPTSSITTATASTTSTTPVIDASIGNPAPSWSGDAFPKTGTVTGDSTAYFQFVVNTSGYSAAKISVDYKIDSNWGGGGATATPTLYVWSSTTGAAGSFTKLFTSSSLTTTFQSALDLAATTTGATSTYFRINAVGAQNGQANMEIDNVIVKATTCGVALQPTIAKAFTPPAIIGAGGSSTLTFTLTNPNTSPLTAVAFSDTLPSGMTIVGAPATPQCGGIINSTAGSVSLTGGTIAASSTCTVQAVVSAASAGQYTNTSGFISSAESGTNTGAGGSATASLTVLAPPAISKTFSPNPIYAGANSTLMFTITNPNAATALSGVTFVDDLPLNLTVPTTPASSQCGGSVSTAPNGSLTRITLTGGSLTAGGSCTVTVLTTSLITGSYVNTSGAVSATTAGIGNTANDTLGVQAVHPGISILKQVAASASGPWSSTVNVAPGANVYYRLTIENIGDVPLSPVSVTDPTLDISSCTWPGILPVGSATADPTAFCVVPPVVAQTGSHSNTATAHGTYSGTVYNSAPSTATYATTALVLVKSATESSFSAAGDLLHYSYAITNTGVGSLPGPVTVTDSNATVSCPSLTSVGNGNSSFDQNETIICAATYTVTALDVSIGSVTNSAYATVSTGTSNTDRKTIYMNLPDLVVSKVNSTGGYAITGVPFTWTVTVSNNGPLPATFTNGQVIVRDQLPATGATYAAAIVGASSGVTNLAALTCAIDGAKLLTCTASGPLGVTIGATTGSFAVSIAVTPTVAGSLVNTAVVDPNNNVAESNEGNNTGSDVVTATTLLAPTIAKAFTIANIVANGSTNLTLTLGNSNGTGITLTSDLTDSFPSGLTLNSGTVTGSCTGVTASFGAASLTIPSGTSIPSGGCTVTVSVTSSTAGSYVNTIAPGALQTSAGNNASAASDTLNVFTPPALSKAFGAASIESGASTTLTLTLTNPAANPAAFTTLQLDDNFPAGLTLQNTTFTFTPLVCGTLTQTDGVTPSAAGDASVRLSVASLAAGSSCQAVMNVTSSTLGPITNTTGAPTATGPLVLTGTPASDGLSVSAALLAPAIAKAFSPATITSGGTSTITFTITNPNASALSNASFTDTLSNMAISADQAAGGTCPGVAGNSFLAGNTVLTFTGISLASGASCTVTVTVTSSIIGINPNSTSGVTTTEVPTAGSGSNIADLTVETPQADLSITKTDGSSTYTPGGSVSYTIVASNAGPSDVIGASVTDNLPADITGVTWACVGAGGATCTASGTGDISDTLDLPSGSTATYTVSGTIAASATSSLSNTATVAAPLGTTDPTPGNNSATDTDTATPAADLAIVKTDSSATYTPGATISYTIIVTNNGPSDVIGASMSDTVPATVTNVLWTCLGTGGATCTASGTGDINELVNLPSGSSVTYTLTGMVSPSASSALTNTATVAEPAGVTDPNPGNNSATDSDGISASADLSVTKTDGSSTYTPGGITTYTIVVSNAGPSSVTGATFADTFPAEITSASWTCVGAGGASCPTASGTGDISATIDLPAGSSLTYTATANISPSATGSLDNTATVTPSTGVTDPTPGNNTKTDSDTGSTSAVLSITKTDGVATYTPGGTTTYTIVVSNAGPSDVTGAAFSDTIPTQVSSWTWSCVAGAGATCTTNPLVPLTSNFTDTIDIPANQAVTYTVAANISASASGDLANTATVNAVSATDTDTSSSFADLQITKTDGSVIFTPGGSITYTVVASNAGPSDVIGASVTDNLPAEITGASWTCVADVSALCTASGAGNISDTVNLPVGKSVTYTLSGTVSATAAGSLANTASIAAPASITDPNPGNNTGTDTDSEVQIIDPALTKSVDPTHAAIGDTVTFTITVTNKGSVAATNVIVTDVLPANLDVVTATSSPSGTVDLTTPGTVKVTIATVAPAAVYTIKILTTVNGLGTPPVQNTASLIADPPPQGTGSDPIANDTAGVTLVITEPGGSGAASGQGHHSLPSTGFAPGVITALPLQPATKAYSAVADIRLEIPSLHINMPIVGVPSSDDNWDVTWLANQAGWLQGTAFPSWSGNSVLTGHVYLSNGLAGPFVNLHTLAWGDQVIIHLSGQRYIYQVRGDSVVSPDDASIFRHEAYPWLTLLTCKDYNAASNTYSHRVAVRAVLIRVEPDSISHITAR